MPRNHRNLSMTRMLLPALVLLAMTVPAMAELQLLCPPHEDCPDFASEPVILDTDKENCSRIHNQQSRAIAKRACISCGNGVPEPGEQCDTGGESATCDVNCTAVACGDGIVNTTAGEQCDDGNVEDGDGCSADCLSEIVAECGNGILESGEQCDDGNNVNTDFCTNACTNATCGDSIVCDTCQPAEECDSGGQTDACDADCTIAVCGDGTLNTDAGEECDDGNQTNGDGCESNCTLGDTSCTSDNDCSSIEFCDASGTCVPKLPGGQPCTSGNQCLNTPHCVDGICCNAQCDGACETCTEPTNFGICTVEAFGHPCNGVGICDGQSGDGCIGG